jgi:uncharacterized NAD(P)/FAD-binding protein YdhS
MVHTALSTPDIEADYVLWLERQIEIIRQRDFAHALEDSPSLGILVRSYVGSQYPRAVEQAVIETGLPKTTFPTSSPYTEQQLLDFDFIP